MILARSGEVSITAAIVNPGAQLTNSVAVTAPTAASVCSPCTPAPATTSIGLQAAGTEIVLALTAVNSAGVPQTYSSKSANATVTQLGPDLWRVLFEDSSPPQQPVDVLVSVAGSFRPSALELSCVCSEASPHSSGLMGWAGHPVGTGAGNLFESVSDLSVPSRGGQLAVNRSYNSLLADTAGSLGFGWRWGFDARLEVLTTPAGWVRVFQPSGVPVLFEKVTSAQGVVTYAPPGSWVNATLVKVGAEWDYTLNNGLRYRFDAAGRLTSIVNRLGYVTNLSYLDGVVDRVTDVDSGRYLQVTWNAGMPKTRVTAVGDGTRSVTFGYDAGGHLSEVNGLAEMSYRYGYDQDTHELTSMRHPRQVKANVTNQEMVNVYVNKKVVSQTDNRFTPARVTTFDYSVPDQTRVTQQPGTDRERVRIDVYAGGQLVEQTTGVGVPGESLTRRFTYDPVTGGLATEAVVEGGVPRVVMSNTYDAEGNLLTTKDGLNRQVTATYNSFGQPLTVTDPAGVVTTNTYSATTGVIESSCTPFQAALPTSGTISCGSPGVTPATTTWGYTAVLAGEVAKPGDVLRVKDPTRLSTGAADSVRYTYGTGGQVASVTDTGGNRTEFTYDAVGRLWTSVAPKGFPASQAAYTSTFDTDGWGRVKTVTTGVSPVTATSSREFDADGQVKSETDADSKKTTYDYNAGGELERTVVGAQGPVAEQLVSETRYWPDGTVKAQIDGALAATDYEYTASGLVKWVEDPLDRRTTYRYDQAGRMEWKQTNGGDCTVVSGSGCTRYGYDNADQLTSLTYSDPVTPDVTTIGYDALGRRTAMTANTGFAGAAETWGWAFDTLGRMASSTDPGLPPTTYTWDLAGRAKDLNVAGAPSVARRYDSTGRMDRSTVSSANVDFGYDANSNLTSIMYPTTTATTDRFTFNELDQLRVVGFERAGGTPPAFTTLTYGRSSAGRLSSSAGSGPEVLPGPGSESYGYDAAGRTSTITGRTPSTFDAAGNLTTRPDGTRQVFDSANQLCYTAGSAAACNAMPTGGTDLDHDLRGNRTRVTPPSGPATMLAYDQADRLVSATVPAQSGSGGQYTALPTAARVLDTRGNSGPRITAGTSRLVTVGGLNSVPTTGVAAVAVNVTAIDATAGGFLRVYPATAALPATSNLNYQAGPAITNLAVTPLSTAGQIRVWVSASTHVIIDVVGWYATPTGQAGGELTAINSSRVLDTRPAPQKTGVCVGSPCDRLPAYTTRTVQVTGQGGVPAAGVAQVVVNITATGGSPAGLLQAYAPGSPPAPGAGINVAYSAGQTISALSFVPVDTNGRITINTIFAAVDVVIDVQGWVSAPTGSNQTYTALTPARVLDTRTPPVGVCDPPGCTRLSAGQARTVQITGQGGVPTSGVTAVLVNVTAAAPSGFAASLTVHQAGTAAPSGSTLAYTTATVANLAVVPLSANGKLTVSNVNGSTDVLLDVQGFYGDPTANWSYTYDPTGLRRTKVAPDGTVTRFVWDRSGSLPLLVAETTGASTTRYLYGPGGLAYAQVRDGTVEYLHHDQLGSTRVITNTAGTTIGRATFEAYGKPDGVSGTATTRLGYAGQYTDPETGYQYLRARYYDPVSGGFLTRDPAVGMTREAYAYVGGNPLNATDPSGLMCFNPTDRDCLGEWGDNLMPDNARGPDYITIDAGVFYPIREILAGPGGGLNIIITRNGTVYFGPQAGVGRAGFSYGVRGGWINTSGKPCDEEIDSFVDGGFVSGGGGPLVQGGVTVNGSGQTASELGFGVAGASGQSGYMWSPFSFPFGLGY